MGEIKKLSVKEIILYIIEIIIMIFDVIMSLAGFISGIGSAGLFFLISAFLISPFCERLLRKCKPIQNSMIARISIQFSLSVIAFIIGAAQLPKNEAVADKDISVIETEQNTAEETITKATETESDIADTQGTTELETEENTANSETQTTEENFVLEESASEEEHGLKLPAENIASLLDATLSASMPEDINSNVMYDDEDNVYIVTVWKDGFANIVATIYESGTNRDGWQDVIDSYVTLCNSLKETADTANSELDSKVILSLLNDQNLSNSLLTIENGIVTYDVLAQ